MANSHASTQLPTHFPSQQERGQNMKNGEEKPMGLDKVRDIAYQMPSWAK